MQVLCPFGEDNASIVLGERANRTLQSEGSPTVFSVNRSAPRHYSGVREPSQMMRPSDPISSSYCRVYSS